MSPSHILFSAIIWAASFVFCLGMGIAFTFFPRWIQELAVKQSVSSTDPFSKLTAQVRQSTVFIWWIRVCGIMALNMAAFLVFFIVRRLIITF
jgi:hypothetical protein